MCKGSILEAPTNDPIGHKQGRMLPTLPLCQHERMADSLLPEPT